LRCASDHTSIADNQSLTSRFHSPVSFAIENLSENLMINPMLTSSDTAAEMKFCKDAFGAAVLSERLWSDGKVIHATLAIGAALFMVHGEMAHLQSRPPQPDGSSSVVIYL
jgi:hypothetical protein